MSNKHQHADLWAKFRALYPDTESRASEPKSTRPGLEVARSLIRTCKEHGVGLRLEPDGDVILESHGKAWRALVRDLEQHVDQVAELLAAGWDGNDG